MKSAQSLAAQVALGMMLGPLPLLAQTINVDYDQSVRFDKMKSYSWGKVQASDPGVEARLAAAVDRVLQGYGFKESSQTGAATKKGDMVLTAVELTDPSQYAQFYQGLQDLDWKRGWSGGQGFSNGAASVDQIAAGTLVIDIYDGTTGKLAWRGTASGDAAAKEKKSEDQVDSEVNKLFNKFPPKNKGKMPPNQMEVPPSPSSTAPTGSH